MENKRYLVYCIRNSENGKEYIGMTHDFAKRLLAHRGNGIIYSFGMKKYSTEILHSDLSLSDALKQEKFFITERHTKWPGGYNRADCKALYIDNRLYAAIDQYCTFGNVSTYSYIERVLQDYFFLNGKGEIKEQLHKDIKEKIMKEGMRLEYEKIKKQKEKMQRKNKSKFKNLQQEYNEKTKQAKENTVRDIFDFLHKKLGKTTKKRIKELIFCDKNYHLPF